MSWTCIEQTTILSVIKSGLIIRLLLDNYIFDLTVSNRFSNYYDNYTYEEKHKIFHLHTQTSNGFFSVMISVA